MTKLQWECLILEFMYWVIHLLLINVHSPKGQEFKMRLHNMKEEWATRPEPQVDYIRGRRPKD